MPHNHRKSDDFFSPLCSLVSKRSEDITDLESLDRCVYRCGFTCVIFLLTQVCVQSYKNFFLRHFDKLFVRIMKTLTSRDRYPCNKAISKRPWRAFQHQPDHHFDLRKNIRFDDTARTRSFRYCNKLAALPPRHPTEANALSRNLQITKIQIN